ncbi:hypothetical protein ACP70R_050195 [Stipagrostis hirtigluma subsp. patula]
MMVPVRDRRRLFELPHQRDACTCSVEAAYAPEGLRNRAAEDDVIWGFRSRVADLTGGIRDNMFAEEVWSCTEGLFGCHPEAC